MKYLPVILVALGIGIYLFRAQLFKQENGVKSSTMQPVEFPSNPLIISNSRNSGNGKTGNASGRKPRVTGSNINRNPTVL